ncbi:Glucanosyltransferase [Xylogone sp. PMI_703]|nr:Glucanosyltransferase [Xylogone sp. PMI_703]
MASQDLPPVSINGRFFCLNSHRFFVRGVVYQVRNRPQQTRDVDPLSDDFLPILERDIPLFKKLQINTILVYSVLEPQSHRAAMEALKKAGIYVILRLEWANYVIMRNAAEASYTKELLQRGFRLIDEFSQYTNTLCFFASMGLINQPDNTGVAEVIRAVIRDYKFYIRLKHELQGTRIIPVGYSIAEAPEIRLDTVKYFSAGSDEERADFLGLHSYDSWSISCAHDAYKRPSEIADELEDIKIPFLLSEYSDASHKNSPARKFENTLALYSEPMTNVFSGGCVYEYIEGPNHYGLVRINEDKSAMELEDFQNLKESLSRSMEKLSTEQVVTADQSPWTGSFPELGENWRARPDILASPIDWDAVRPRLQAEAQK